MRGWEKREESRFLAALGITRGQAMVGGRVRGKNLMCRASGTPVGYASYPSTYVLGYLLPSLRDSWREAGAT